MPCRKSASMKQRTCAIPSNKNIKTPKYDSLGKSALVYKYCNAKGRVVIPTIFEIDQ